MKNEPEYLLASNAILRNHVKLLQDSNTLLLTRGLPIVFILGILAGMLFGRTFQ